MDEAEQQPTAGDIAKDAGALARLLASALALLTGVLLAGAVLLLMLVILGVVVWGAWSISWVLGLPITVLVLYLLLCFFQGKNI